MKSLCHYKNLFGKPGKGIHSFRIANLAIFDIIITLLFAYILCLLFPNIPKYIFFIGIFILGVVAHRLFCVKTTINNFLFPNMP